MNGKLSKAEGIILSRKNVGEADRIVTVFTKEHGKLRLMAKGIRKIASKRAPHLEVFSHATLMIHHGHSLDTITEVTSITTFEDLRSDLDCISVAYFYCELVNLLLPEKQEHGDVFLLLSQALSSLGDDKSAMYRDSKAFALTLLRMLGFLETNRQLGGKELQSFIENITERKLRTPRLIRQLLYA